MAVTTSVLTDQLVPGIGLQATGTFNLSGSYTAGGENLDVKYSIVTCGIANEYTAHYDSALKKLRIFKITGGVPTEATAGPYTGSPKIPFFAVGK